MKTVKPSNRKIREARTSWPVTTLNRRSQIKGGGEAGEEEKKRKKKKGKGSVDESGLSSPRKFDEEEVERVSLWLSRRRRPDIVFT